MTPELRDEESVEELKSGMSEKEPAPLQARGAAAFRIVDAEVARPAVGASSSRQGKHVFIYTPDGIRRLWTLGGEQEYTVVSQEAAQRYGLREESRRQATWIVGLTGVTVGLDTDYEVFLLADDSAGAHRAHLRTRGEVGGEVLWLAHRDGGRVQHPAGKEPCGAPGAAEQISATQDGRQPFRALVRNFQAIPRICQKRRGGVA
jgi:hypothetical protein